VQPTLETGVAGLDVVLGGGLPHRDTLLLLGPPGAGKTTLLFQLAFHAARAGRKALYVSTFSEPPERLVRHLRALDFYDEALLGQRVPLLNGYAQLQQGATVLLDALVAAVRAHGADLLLFDGLTGVRDLEPDVRGFRRFVYELARALASLGCTTVLTGVHAGGEPDLTDGPELTMADAVLALNYHHLGVQTVRTLRVVKVRGQAPLLGRHALRIGADGLTVFPRLESLPLPAPAPLPPARKSTGLPELDVLLGGGLPGGSATLLAGATGTGKTLLALGFLLDGARRGEKGLLLSLREAPAQLLARGRGLGMDLEGALARGALGVLYRRPAELVTDELLGELDAAVARETPARVVVDSLLELELSVEDARRRRGVLVSLAGLLRARGATTVFTRELPPGVGPGLDTSASPLDLVSENVLLLRNREDAGRLHHILSVLKMRESDFAPGIREYTIGAGGLRLRAPEETHEGLLQGIARMPSELRVKGGDAPGGGGEPGGGAPA
jgi:circadian clock protein KaiC